MKDCLLVAEIGINASGDVNIAKKLIDIAKLGGCEFVKFQKRTVEDVYSKEELDKYRESPFGTTNRAQKIGIEFEKDEYDEIDKCCKEKEIKWFASPWDIKSVDFLMQYNVPYIKVASASITDKKLLNKIKETSIPVIISTGMSTQKEIDECLEILGSQVYFPTYRLHFGPQKASLQILPLCPDVPSAQLGLSTLKCLRKVAAKTCRYAAFLH